MLILKDFPISIPFPSSEMSKVAQKQAGMAPVGVLGVGFGCFSLKNVPQYVLLGDNKDWIYFRETKVVSSGKGCSWLLSLYLRFPVEGTGTWRFGLGKHVESSLSPALSTFGAERGCGG